MGLGLGLMGLNRLFCLVSGYLKNVWRSSDLLVLVHIPQHARLSHFTVKGKYLV